MPAGNHLALIRFGVHNTLGLVIYCSGADCPRWRITVREIDTLPELTELALAHVRAHHGPAPIGVTLPRRWSDLITDDAAWSPDREDAELEAVSGNLGIGEPGEHSTPHHAEQERQAARGDEVASVALLLPMLPGRTVATTRATIVHGDGPMHMQTDIPSVPVDVARGKFARLRRRFFPRRTPADTPPCPPSLSPRSE